MSKYLEENGLAHFWDKIKQLVNTAKQQKNSLPFY